MTKYYFAIKGCSRSIQKRSIISVNTSKDNQTSFFIGPTDDKFEYEDNKLICITETGGLEYNIIGPLKSKQLTDLLNTLPESSWGDLTKERRPHSYRRLK